MTGTVRRSILPRGQTQVSVAISGSVVSAALLPFEEAAAVPGVFGGYGDECEVAIIAVHLPEAFGSNLRYDVDIGYEVVCDSPIPAAYLQMLDGSFNPLST